MVAIPEVRQCHDNEHFLFGAVAVAGDGTMAGKWGVMHPANGGHWSTDEEVADWLVLQPPGIEIDTEAAPEPEPEPEPEKVTVRRKK